VTGVSNETSQGVFAAEDEFSVAMQPILQAIAAATPLAPTDWKARRSAIERGFHRLTTNLPEVDAIQRRAHLLPAGIPMTEFVPLASPVFSTLVYAHGGGRFAGTVTAYEPLLRTYASLGVRVVAVDYRRPPEEPLPAAITDLIDTLTWARQTFTGRVLLGGDSGGAGLAIAASLTLRDAGMQPPDGLMAIYPMLDDRTTTAPAELTGRLLWTDGDNRAAWSISTPHPTDRHLVPARTEELSGLPPTYFEVGTIDLFASETIQFAARSAQAGNAVTLRTVPNAPHAYDLLVPDATHTRRSWEARRVFLLDLPPNSRAPEAGLDSNPPAHTSYKPLRR